MLRKHFVIAKRFTAALALAGCCGQAFALGLGQLIPIARGVTPGPATAFLALLGYDPLTTSLDEGAPIEPFEERHRIRSTW